MKDHTRIDIFENADALIAFYEWAKSKNPQTKADMERLLAEYKKPDMVVKGFKEHVEHKLMEEFKSKAKKEVPNE